MLACLAIFGCSRRTAGEAKNGTGCASGDAASERSGNPSLESEGIAGGEREERIRTLIHSAFGGGSTEEERLSATCALIDLGGEDVAVALVEAFRTGEQEDRKEIIEILSTKNYKKHTSAVADALADLFRGSSTPDLRAAVADALVNLQSFDLGSVTGSSQSRAWARFAARIP